MFFRFFLKFFKKIEKTGERCGIMKNVLLCLNGTPLLIPKVISFAIKNVEFIMFEVKS